VKKLIPTGNAIVNNGNGIPNDSPCSTRASDCAKNE
jgi:hypothetical protein